MPSHIQYVGPGNTESYSHTSEFEPNWDDERTPATLGRQGALSKPDFDYTNIGVLMPQNDAAEIMYIGNQFPHSTKTGKIIVYPHIHYLQDEAGVPVFKMDHRFYNNGETPPAFTTGLSTADGAGLVFPYTSGTILQIIEFPPIEIDNVLPSMWYDIKVYRDDNAVAGDVVLKGFDFHRPIDTLGSEQLYIK